MVCRLNDLALRDNDSDETYARALGNVRGLKDLVTQQEAALGADEVIEAMELVIEGLFQYNLLSKEDSAHGASYADMLATMMQGMGR